MKIKIYTDTAEVKIRDCAWCKGTGRLRNSITGSRRNCDVCGGKGKNAFTGRVEICGKCVGTGISGKNLMNDPIKCDVCHGKGFNQF